MLNKKTEGIIQIIFAIVIVIGAFYLSNDVTILQKYGYAGVFLISLLSSATLFLPAPGWAAVIAMSSILDPILLGVTAGIGSAIGELTGYIAGDGARDLFNKKIKESEKIEKWVKKYDVIAILLFAAIPNPLFDIAGIVAGGLKIPWWRYLIACAAGRIVRYVALAIVGNFTLGLI